MTAVADHVLAIAQDTFTALVDQEPGHVTEWGGAGVTLHDPVHAWVDVRSAHPVRTVVTTGHATAERITRALLHLGPEEAVPTADVRDALGEMANVIGGNLKGLMPESGALTVPVVERGSADLPDPPEWERHLRWREDPLVISMWNLDTNLDGKGQQ